MAIFLLLLICQLITLDDLQTFWEEILNLKYGTLTRLQYFGCTWMASFVLGILGSVIIANASGMTLTGSRGLGYYLAYGFVYIVITFVQISAFCRRMNDAGLSKWYTLVFLIPGIGNIVAILIALMPTGFGDSY